MSHAGPSDPFVMAGERRLPVDLSGDFDFEPPVHLPPLDDLQRRIGEALATPLGSPPLAELARDARRVVVAVPDLSRPCPTALLLPPLLDELARGGVTDDHVRVLVACGLHRTTTREEKAAVVGPRLAGRIRVEDAQGQRQTSLHLGLTSDHRDVWMNAAVARADLVVSLGVVEPHLYAGFSGGVKTVAVGCAGEQTIAWTHDPVFLDRPEIRVGRLRESPFRRAMQEIAAYTALRFALNAVLDARGGVAGLAAGDPDTAQRSLVETHGQAWRRTRDDEYDLVVAGLPAPKHESLYHASRAATYLTLAERPVVAEGGLIALCSDLPLGFGDGPAEANFAALLTATGEPAKLLTRARHEPLGPGGQRAYMVAKALERCRIGVVGDAGPTLLEGLGLLSFRSLAEAVAEARRARGAKPRVLVVADAFNTLVERAAQRGKTAGATPTAA